MSKFSETNLFGMTIRESANDGSDFTNPSADYRRLFLGEDGQLHVRDSAGAVTDIGAAPGDILDLTTAETDDTLVLAPDGAGGVEFRAETGGGGPSLPGGVTGLGTWFDAGALSGYSDGDPVSTWPNVMTEGGSGGEGIVHGTVPLYKTNIINSLPIVRFAGAGWYTFSSNALLAQSSSVFIAFKMSSLANAYSGIIGNSLGGDLGGFMIKSNGKSANYPSTSTSYDGTGAITYGTSNFNYTSLIQGPTTYDTRRNGSADKTGTAWAGITNGIMYGFMLGNQVVASRVMTGDIAEVLIYNRALTSSEVTTIESYLSTKYAL